jgi:flagellar basal body-associated protein FliL
MIVVVAHSAAVVAASLTVVLAAAGAVVVAVVSHMMASLEASISHSHQSYKYTQTAHVLQYYRELPPASVHRV